MLSGDEARAQNNKTKGKEELSGKEANNKEKEEISSDKSDVNQWKFIRERSKENQKKIESISKNK